MSQSNGELALSARLPSNLESYHEFIKSVLDRLESLGWPQRDLFGVCMALEESISNAVRHGNRLDASKIVDVECRCGKDRFWGRITDEGPGFDPKSVPDCCAPERLEQPGGRGLTLIKAYMTTAEYNARGNSLTIEKRLGESSESSDDE